MNHAQTQATFPARPRKIQRRRDQVGSPRFLTLAPGSITRPAYGIYRSRLANLDDQTQLCRLSLPARGHSSDDLVVSSVHAQFARRRGLAGRASDYGSARDSSPMGKSFRPDHCGGFSKRRLKPWVQVRSPVVTAWRRGPSKAGVFAGRRPSIGLDDRGDVNPGSVIDLNRVRHGACDHARPLRRHWRRELLPAATQRAHGATYFSAAGSPTQSSATYRH